MVICCKCFRECICHIFIYVYVGVVDYSAFVQISTIVIANVDVLRSSFDESRGDLSESTLIVAVDWHQW
jgi:hypothetical protein